MCPLQQICLSHCGWSDDGQMQEKGGACFPVAVAREWQVGLMETCARIDSISERQLPWVNGGVILLPLPSPRLHLLLFLQESTHHSPGSRREKANGLSCTHRCPFLHFCFCLLPIPLFFLLHLSCC